MPGVSVPAPAAPRFALDADDFPRALDWSASGEELAWGTSSGGVQIVRGKDGAPLRSVCVAGGGVMSLAWNPREPRLCVGSEDGSLAFINAADGSIMQLLAPSGAWLEHVAWNPKGSKLAAALGRSAAVMAADGRVLVNLPELESTISGLAWSPDGTQLACACYGGVRLFDPKTGRRLRSLDWKGSMISLAWRPGGHALACGCQDNSVHFWRLPAGKDSQMSGYPAKPKAIAWSPDGHLLATSGAPQITVWSFAGKGPEGTAPVELSAHEELVTALAFSPVVGMLASGCRGGRGYFWAPDEIARPVRAFAMTGRIEALRWALAPAEENVLLAGSDANGRIAVWALR